MRKLTGLSILFATLLLVGMPAQAQHNPMQPASSIAEIVVAASDADQPEFTILLAALQATNLDIPLSQDGMFTVFAPTDAAFQAYADQLGVSLDDLLELSVLPELLQLHVVGAVLPEVRIRNAIGFDEAIEIETLSGVSVEVGVIDDRILVDDAEVILTDIFATNGVIHVIDTVLTFDMEGSPARRPGNNLTDNALPTITDIVVNSAGDRANPQFTVLLQALRSASLVSTFSGEGSFTIFAPTDDAFTDLIDALDVTPAELLQNPGLATILGYHVVPAALDFATIALILEDADSLEVQTLTGETVLIEQRDNGVFVNDSEIVQVDIQASNGIIHVIDAVLLPPSLSTTDHN